MIKFLFYGLLGFVTATVLIGCRETYDYSYLMMHPDVLKEQIIQCQSDNPSSQCDVVKKAMADFFALVDERNNSIPGFAEKIMTAERDMIAARNQSDEAEAQYEKMRDLSSNALQIEEQWKKVTVAQEAYDKANDQVQILWAVISATTSE